MSLPKFPFDPSTMTRDDAINLILTSIAMEEVGLSHILNAEGEKLQYVLGTLEGVSGPTGVTVEQVLQVNDSVTSLLRHAASNQQALSDKMEAALNSPTMAGPTGPAGETPEISIDATTGNWIINGVDTGMSSVGTMPPPIVGQFFSFSGGTFSGGGSTSGVIIPVETASPYSDITSFTLLSDGSVQINVAGLYLVSGRVQMSPGANAATFAVQINGHGLQNSEGWPIGNGFTIQATGGTGSVTTLLQLNVGDTVSNALVSFEEFEMTPNVSGDYGTSLNLYKIG